jgi:hypothetical protein
MATATELADKLHKWRIVGCGTFGINECQQAVAELRRIPDLERQLADAERMALTGEESNAVVDISRRIERNGEITIYRDSVYGTLLAELSARLSPPPIVWTDVGDGSIAEFNGWTIVVRPKRSAGHCFSATKQGADIGAVEFPAKDRDAAKSAAEAWVRQQGEK